MSLSDSPIGETSRRSSGSPPSTGICRLALTAVLVIAIAYQLATLTWTLVPGSTPAASPAAARRRRDAVRAPATDFQRL